MEEQPQKQTPLPAVPIAVSVQAATAAPAELAAIACAAGAKKARGNYVRMFLMACVAGALIGVGGMCSVSVGKGLPNADSGLQRFAFGAVFPVGLILVVLTGAELITGNFAVLLLAWLNRRVALWEVVAAWVVVYAGNLVGSLGLAYFFAFLTDLYAAAPYLPAVQALAEGKVAQSFGALVLSGMACNWLVCLAVLLAMGARSTASKALVVWFPIQTFVTVGFEHSVANMTLVPIGILYGADVSFGEFVLHNLIPVTLGNMLGAWLLVALVEWFVFGIDRGVWHLDACGSGARARRGGAKVLCEDDQQQQQQQQQHDLSPVVEEEGALETQPEQQQQEQADGEQEHNEHQEEEQKKHKRKHSKKPKKKGHHRSSSSGKDDVPMESVA